MCRALHVFVWTLLILPPATAQPLAADVPVESSVAYLGQQPPGPDPELFAPGMVSTALDELNAVFSPDGSLFLFTVKLPGRALHILMHMKLEDGEWSPPRTLPFSGVYDDADPAFSMDGRSVYFISTRPLDASDTAEKDWDIWVVDRLGDGWTKPRNLGPPVNSDQIEVYPSLAENDTLYYSSGRPGGMGRMDLYRTKLVEGRFSEPENLGEAINSEYTEGDLYVAPDESYLIFTTGRPGDFGSSDLYVSFRQPDGSWTAAKNMGEAVNSKYQEYCPVVSPDGKYFFFTSYKPGDLSARKPLTYDAIQEIYQIPQNGLGDVYWMDAGILDRLRPSAER